MNPMEVCIPTVALGQRCGWGAASDWEAGGSGDVEREAEVVAGEEATDAGHGSRVPDPAVHLRAALLRRLPQRAARGHVLQAVGHLG